MGKDYIQNYFFIAILVLINTYILVNIRLGGECLSVSQSSVVSKWFRGKELAFALGLNLSVSRLGSVLNNAIVPPVYAETENFGTAFLVGFIICIFSLICGICIIILDKYADKVDGAAGKMIAEEDKFKWSDLKTFNASFWIISGSCVFTYMAIFPFL